MVGFVVKFWWLLVSALAVVAVAYVVRSVWRERDAAVERERDSLAKLVARADQQHAWVLAGDDRGIYGEWPREAHTFCRRMYD
jgi:hypothetical protein